ncbi:heme-binding protein [Geobacter sp. AOG2]|uniref:SOUL family heme-binding protein n=1 Tax=Geobacter sp. AOG2 TaxID=1566347 RepID=UPI001CC419E2|nr:heme-binding protein [Geobacter sp. AOG2]GFE60127.1 hypothetical protein AOG2_07150 [Geobacter sp. AOG2]
MITIVAGIMMIILLIWIIGGYVPTMNIHTPAHTVREKRAGYEIREYEPYVIAETLQKRSGDEASPGGFNELFRYISGNNVTRSRLDMSAPVLRSADRSGRKIPMSAPVLKDGAGGTGTIAFVMPPGKRPDELPLPKSAAVHLREIPARTVAAVSFTGYATDAVLGKYTAELLAALKRDGIVTRSAPLIALYNPPWTPPFMRRNEVLVEIVLP